MMIVMILDEYRHNLLKNLNLKKKSKQTLLLCICFL